MSPIPLAMSRIYVEQRQAELRASAGRHPRPRRLRRVRRWAHGWLDRSVPSSTR